ncbi:hypothetical protein FJ546_07940 [Mesorhizobium sp. B2-4-19]|uniref:hypothetical protein n=1 Tax=Mesorhizobium sp. B2-4-19 TaxID=2589930 RepID=UPI00112CB661|nr:hypothetical protein [Mesorhizobium sp. B2-4-19]TPK66666.1 hypothetical protein FJ546_07940 [Mesorhizobium sp. B2-4-19]
MLSDILRFFRAWILDPLRVASITLSSAALASLMVSEISSRTGSVIELGPGTGVFTHALIRQGLAFGTNRNAPRTVIVREASFCQHS